MLCLIFPALPSPSDESLSHLMNNRLEEGRFFEEYCALLPKHNFEPGEES